MSDRRKLDGRKLDGRKSDEASRFPLGLTLVTAVALLILLGLGSWQMQRLGWKRALLADYARTEALPPVTAEALLGQSEQADWRQVVLPDCEVVPERIVYLHGVAEGVAGYHLLTPCPVAGGYVLTDLGFRETRAEGAVPVTLTGAVGRLRPFEKINSFMPPNDAAGDDWYQRRVDDLSARWGLTLRGDYYVALTGGGVLGARAVDVTHNLSNRHLEYALTWYGLAVTLLLIYLAVIFRRSGKRPA